MGKLGEFWRRLRFFWRREQLEDELGEEMRFHLEMKILENIDAGMSPGEARRAARLQFGNEPLAREDSRDSWGFRGLDELAGDLRFAFRSYAKNPTFTLTALLTLALSIGVGTTVFAMVNAVMFRPLPYPDLDRLVRVWMVNEELGVDVGRQRRRNQSMSPIEGVDWRDRSKIFEEMRVFSYFNDVSLLGDGVYALPTVLMMEQQLFELLGMQPMLGRLPLGEEAAGEEYVYAEQGVLLLQHHFWQTHFGGDPDIIGKRVHIEHGSIRMPRTVIGVMPPGFVLADRTVDAFIPVRIDEAWASQRNRTYRAHMVIAKLKSGMSLSEAQVRADVFAAGLEKQHPERPVGWRPKLVPIADDAVGDLYAAMTALLGAVALILLVACSNLANLFLMRASVRTKEIAVRSAIGAGRGRLIRQMLVESLCLAVAGGALGLGLAAAGIHFLRAASPDAHGWSANLVQLDALDLDLSVVLFAAAATIAMGLFFGLIPGVLASKPDLNRTLKDAGRGSVSSHSRRLQNSLVVAQVALAVVIVVGAGLLVRSFVAIYRQGPGITYERMLSVHVKFSTREDRTATRTMGLETPLERHAAYLGFLVRRWRSIDDKLNALPGVTGVAGVQRLVFDGFVQNIPTKIQGRAEEIAPLWKGVTPSYFSVAAVPLIRGRLFDERLDLDVAWDMARFGGSRKSPVLVNQAFVRRYLPNEDAVGKLLRAGRHWEKIIGVVGDVRELGMNQPAPPIVYSCMNQYGGERCDLIIRTETDPLSLAPAVRKIILEGAPDAAVERFRLLEDVVRDSTYLLNYSVLILSTLGGLALLLAAIGVYGTLSYSVRERTREIGLRMALGAGRAQVLGTVLRRGFGLVGAGVAIGLVAAAGLTRFLGNLLFGVEALDLSTFAMVCFVLLATALLASYLPARRAANVDPMTALRHE